MERHPARGWELESRYTTRGWTPMWWTTTTSRGRKFGLVPCIFQKCRSVLPATALLELDVKKCLFPPCFQPSETADEKSIVSWSCLWFLHTLVGVCKPSGMREVFSSFRSFKDHLQLHRSSTPCAPVNLRIPFLVGKEQFKSSWSDSWKGSLVYRGLKRQNAGCKILLSRRCQVWSVCVCLMQFASVFISLFASLFLPDVDCVWYRLFQYLLEQHAENDPHKCYSSPGRCH